MLFRREACDSMHVYATTRLHLSDAEAYLRITVARVSRRYPAVLSMLADGRLHLTAIALLAPHLDRHGGEALLVRAVHLSKREVERLVAEIAPRPDAPSRIRRLPERRAFRPDGAEPPAAEAGPGAPGDPVSVSPSGDASGAPSAPASTLAEGAPPAAPAASTALTDRPRFPAMVAPTAAARYKVQFSAGQELHDQIRRAQALLRHQVPDGDLTAIFERAMTLLLRDLERTRFAATTAPRPKAAPADPTPTSRHIPAAIKRAVWKRDGEQCTFRDRSGRRCPARERLEFHDLVAFAHGGEHSESNLTLRCSMHNAYQADLDFGAEFMAARRRGSPARCPPVVYGSGSRASDRARRPVRATILGPRSPRGSC